MAARSPRFHGILSSWNDERGFGFISPTEGDGRGGKTTFVHITAFPASLSRRPHVGDALSFELRRPSGGKPEAAYVQVAGHAPRVIRGRPAARARPRVTRVLPIVVFVVGCVALNATWALPAWVAPTYAVISILTFIAYAADKSAATAGEWRVSERTLLLLGLLGGWPGAIVAQQVLRHKTRKASFRSAFWGTVVAIVVVFAFVGTPLGTVILTALPTP